MTILDNSYDNLKLLAIEKYNANKSITDINYLKEFFTLDINSPRCLSHISDVTSLIAVLEKRGVLSPVNIEAFDLIYSVLQLKNELLDKHKELLKINQDCLFTRLYENDISNEHKVPGYKHNNLGNTTSELNSKSSPVNSGLLPDKVVNTVCSQIGISWKSLARYLKVVQESIIEQIEEDRTIKNDESRARLVLKEFQEKEDPSELRTRLLKALRLAGRKDIHDQIEKYF